MLNTDRERTSWVSPAFAESRARAIPILNVLVDALTTAELHQRIFQTCATRDRALVLHANAHALNIAVASESFRSILNKADCVFCDGSGVRLAASLSGRSIPERITYADWAWEFAGFCADKGLSWFLLGGAEGRAAAAAASLRARFPKLKIVGAHHGYFDRSAGSVENAKIVSAINAATPDILLVGFGMPLQEQWFDRNWQDLKVHVGLTGGAVFDYVSGALRRPSWFLRAVGMEWLGRLLIEPRRLAARYLIGNPVFLMRAIVWGARVRLQRRGWLRTS